MRYQISNKQNGLTTGLLFIVLAFSAIAVSYSIDRMNGNFSFFNFTMSASGIFCFFAVWYYLVSGRFYNVAFDNEFIYFSRFGNEQKISLAAVISVSPGIFPMRQLSQNVYAVTVRFTGMNNDVEQIKFLSERTGVDGTIDDIKFLDKLREQIKEKRWDALSS